MSKNPTVFIIAPYCTILHHIAPLFWNDNGPLFIIHKSLHGWNRISVARFSWPATWLLTLWRVAQCCTAGTHLHHEPVIGKMVMDICGSNMIKTYIYILYDTIVFDDPCNLYDSWSFTLTILMITGAPGFLSPCRCLTMSSGSNTKRIRSSLVVHIVFVWREVLISDGTRCSNGLKDTIRYLLYSLSNIQNLNKNNLLVASEF